MDRLFVGITIFFLALLFIGCASPLEDVEIEDFNLIRATFNVYREVEVNKTDNSTHTRTVVEAIFEDKNFHNMELKGANVTVNGKVMDYDDNALVRRYKSTLSLTPHSTYTFKVTLVNGDTASAVLITDEVDFSGISYASHINLGTDYPITWNNRGSDVHTQFWLYDTPEFSSLVTLLDTNSVDQGVSTLLGSESGKEEYAHIKYGGFKLTRQGTYTISDKFRGEAAAVYSSYFVEGITAQ